MKVGYDLGFSPFSYLKDGKASGLVIERIIAIFEKARISLELIPAELTELGEGLTNGRFDMLAVMAKTKERVKTLSFTKPIIVSGGAWFNDIISSPLMDGELPKSAITPKVGPLVSQINNLFPEIDLITSENYDTSLKAVLDGKADAAALNWHVGRMLIDEKYQGFFHIPAAPFNTMPLYMAGRKDDPNGMIDRLNMHIPADWGPDPV